MKPTTNIRKEPAGWQVRLVRNGEEHAKYFRFSNGGIRASFQRARKWRDARLKKLGERKWRKGPHKKKPTHNSSGIVGVSKNPYGRWVATWHEDGKQHFKTFKLRREAVAHRKAQEKRLASGR